MNAKAAADQNSPSPAGKLVYPKPGEHFFEMAKLDTVMGGADYSSAVGSCVVGQKIMAALMRMPAGTGAEPHSHPNEQWVYVIEGALEMKIDDRQERAEAGTAIYIPGDAVHSSRVAGDTDAVFFTVKDTSWGLAGVKR